MKTPRLVVAFVLMVNPGFADGPAMPPAKAPAVLELRDQYDEPQRLAFPATNVVILTIADKKGAEQIDGWVAAIKARYSGRIDLRGLADVGGVPALWRGKVRKKFQETRQHPVMMDWTGKACAQFGYQAGVANLLIIARDGTIHSRISGPASAATLKGAYTAIDAALAAASVPATVPTAKAKSSEAP